MKPIVFAMVAVLGGLVLGLTAVPARADVPDDSKLNELVAESQAQLDTLYAQAEPGEVPTGSSDGRAMFFPGTMLNEPAALLASYIWQGKVFDLDGKFLVNRVLGFKAIRAKVYKGVSWFDGKESIIIDYKDTSLVAFLVRDEIREISPGLYLGRAYIRTLLGPVLGVNFALQFANDSFTN